MCNTIIIILKIHPIEMGTLKKIITYYKLFLSLPLWTVFYVISFWLFTVFNCTFKEWLYDFSFYKPYVFKPMSIRTRAKALSCLNVVKAFCRSRKLLFQKILEWMKDKVSFISEFYICWIWQLNSWPISEQMPGM